MKGLVHDRSTTGRRGPAIVTIMAAAGALFGQGAAAQPPVPPAIVVQGTAGTPGTDTEPGARMGDAVAMRGGVALIGVPRDSLATAVVAGSIKVYRRDAAGWLYDTKLIAPQSVAYGRLGSSLDFDGTRAVAGAPGEDGASTSPPQSKVHVFIRETNGWRHEAELAAPPVGNAVVTKFGRAVAIDGDRLAAAALASPAPGEQYGVVFVYRREASWNLEATLAAPAISGVELAGFGATLDLADDDLLAATAPTPTIGAGGEVFAFRRDPATGWNAGERLTPTGGVPVGARFGADIDIAQGLVAIAAPGSFAQFVFERTPGGWRPQARIERPGTQVALAPPRLFIGGWGAGPAAWFEFSAGEWTLGGSVAPPPRSVDFGAALAADGDRVLAGDAESGVSERWRSGRASVHRIDGTTARDEAVFEDPEVRPERVGTAVALAGDIALVGAPESGPLPGAGRVRWLERRGGSWVEGGSLRPPGEGADRQFGASIALRGRHALIGAFGASASGQAFGTEAFLYRRAAEGWLHEATLTVPAGGSLVRGALALTPDGALIGAPGTWAGAAPSSGVVHVFGQSNGTWSLTQTIEPEASPFQDFGEAIAVHGDLLLVGAPSAGTGASPGYVAVFVRIGGAWRRQGTLTTDRPSAGFGRAIWLDDAAAWIGAPGGMAPAVFRFPRGPAGFEAPEVFEAPVAARGGGFGTALSGAGDRVFVGAPWQGLTLEQPRLLGAVYRIRRTGGAWQIDGQWSATDVSPSTEVFGVSIAADALAFLVGAPQSGGSLPYGNPGEGAAVLYEDGGLLMRDGFEP